MNFDSNLPKLCAVSSMTASGTGDVESIPTFADHSGEVSNEQSFLVNGKIQSPNVEKHDLGDVKKRISSKRKTTVNQKDAGYKKKKKKTEETKCEIIESHKMVDLEGVGSSSQMQDVDAISSTHYQAETTLDKIKETYDPAMIAREVIIDKTNISDMLPRIHHRTKKNIANAIAKEKVFYECPICAKLFLYKSALYEQHYPQHFGVFLCKFCKDIFETKAEVLSHSSCKEKHELDNRVVCSVCDKVFKSPQILRAHESTHKEKNLEDRTCNICQTIFRAPSKLQTHNIEKHGMETDFYCDGCEKYFPSNYVLVNHSHESTMFKCNLCDKKYTTKGSLKRHYKEFHPNQWQETDICSNSNETAKSLHPDKELLSADLCVLEGEKITGTPIKTDNKEREHESQKHLTVNNENQENDRSKSVSCSKDVELGDEVNKKLTKNEVLSRLAKPSKTCSICNKTFGSLNLIRRHNIRMHGLKSNFYCNDCDKYFDSGRVRRKHKCDKNYFKCDVCKASFDAKAKLQYHYDKNHATKILQANDVKVSNHKSKEKSDIFGLLNLPSTENKCKICNHTYRSSSLLRRHNIRKHGAKSDFQCKICTKYFCHSYLLKMHMDSHNKYDDNDKDNSLQETDHHEEKGEYSEISGSGQHEEVQIIASEMEPISSVIFVEKIPESETDNIVDISGEGIKFKEVMIDKNNYEEYRERIATKWAKIDKTKQKLRLYECPICELLFFNRRALTNCHYPAHFERHLCKFCNKLFPKGSLKTHSTCKGKYDSERLEYKCEICEKCFKSLYPLKVHMRTHQPKRKKENVNKQKRKVINAKKRVNKHVIKRKGLRSSINMTVIEHENLNINDNNQAQENNFTSNDDNIDVKPNLTCFVDLIKCDDPECNKEFASVIIKNSHVMLFHPNIKIQN